MAITVEDKKEIERDLSERYVLVRRDAWRTGWVLFAYAIGALSLAEIITILLRAALIPISVDFELQLPVVSELAFGMWLPVSLACVTFATLAKQFVPRLSKIADIWNLVAFWLAIAAAALSVAGTVVAGVTLVHSLG
jgi:hypothetical protein